MQGLDHMYAFSLYQVRRCDGVRRGMQLLLLLLLLLQSLLLLLAAAAGEPEPVLHEVPGAAGRRSRRRRRRRGVGTLPPFRGLPRGGAPPSGRGGLLQFNGN